MSHDITHYILYDFWQWVGEPARRFDTGINRSLSVNITSLTFTGQQLAKDALEAWSVITGIQFNLTFSSNADIVFSDDGFLPETSDTYIGVTKTQAFVNVPSSMLYTDGNTVGSFTYTSYLHEIGHALGLGHPGPYPKPGVVGRANFSQDAVYILDSWSFTVMSYFNQNDNTILGELGFTYAHPITPMTVDIEAIHRLYGKPFYINYGDTVYGYDSNLDNYLGDFFRQNLSAGIYTGDPFAMTVIDTGGNDTFDFRTDIYDQVIDLNTNGTGISNIYGSVGNLVIYPGTVIENVVAGPGNDMIAGNAADNFFDGGAGADTISGHLGHDTLSYLRSPAGVNVNLDTNINTGGHAEGDSLKGIQVIFGSFYNDSLTGNNSGNFFFGNSGNDVLYGGGGVDVLEGGPGADRLSGGDGDDITSFLLSGVGVVVRLHSATLLGGDAEGDLFAEIITVDGIDVPDIESLQGSDYADTLAGDHRNNYIWGYDGDDILYGGPGGGDDYLSGGNGNDKIYGGIGDDHIIGGSGNDLLSGGVGEDTFEFYRWHGDDVIRGFESGIDTIDLTALSIETDIPMEQVEADTVIDLTGFDGGTITLADTNIASVSNDDFLIA